MINRRYAASVIVRITHGYRIPTSDMPLFKIHKVLDTFTTITYNRPLPFSLTNLYVFDFR